MDLLFSTQLSEKQSLGAYIIQTFLSPSKDFISLYSTNKTFKKKFREKCPICKSILHPKIKRKFQLGLKNLGTHLDLPDSPCQNNTCNSKIFGYICLKPKYRLKMFYTSYDLKRHKKINTFLQDSKDEMKHSMKEYRRAFKSGNMYYTGPWG